MSPNSSQPPLSGTPADEGFARRRMSDIAGLLAIFSVVWRWNDFLWPLVVLSRNEVYTLQVALNTYAGELNVQWHFILAMTVVTMIPVVVVFIFLQRFITTGIAGSGLK